MKKTVTRAALLLLVLALTVSMAACKKKDAVKNDTLTGKWAVSNDLSELLASDARKVKPEQAELLKDMKVSFVLQLNADGTFVTSAEEEELGKTARALRRQLYEDPVNFWITAKGYGSKDEYLSKHEDLTAEDLPAIFALEKEVDEYSDAELVSEVVQELGIDCWLENVEQNQVTGTWRTENGKIWFQDTANPGAEEGSAAYTLAGDQLKLTEMNNVCFNRDLTQDDTLTLKRRAD